MERDANTNKQARDIHMENLRAMVRYCDNKTDCRRAIQVILAYYYIQIELPSPRIAKTGIRRYVQTFPVWYCQDAVLTTTHLKKPFQLAIVLNDKIKLDKKM